jgi:hypothetical protein
MYMSVSEALECTNVEKLNPLDKKYAPGMSAEVTSLAVVVVSLFHVPLPVVLVFVGVNLHNVAVEGVEQDPAYTDISLAEDMEGMNAVELSVVNGRLGVIVSRDRFDGEIVEDMLREASWCVFDSELPRKTYAMSLLLEEPGGRRIVVGLYGGD